MRRRRLNAFEIKPCSPTIELTVHSLSISRVLALLRQHIRSQAVPLAPLCGELERKRFGFLGSRPAFGEAMEVPDADECELCSAKAGAKSATSGLTGAALPHSLRSTFPSRIPSGGP